MPDRLTTRTEPSASSVPAPHEPVSLKQAWLAETLRLRESLWGPLEDADEIRRARTLEGSLQQKLLHRAQALGAREQLDTVLQRYAQGARLTLIALWLAAILAGAGAAVGALGDATRSVNVLLALVAMLGINTLAMILWLASFALRSSDTGSWLGELWLWLTKKLARGPNAALAPQALAGLLDRQHALRWVLGGISHGWWTTALLSLLLTLLAVLSARRYQFNWETTLLTPDSFVHITAWLGWLPSKLGFPIPSEAIVRASSGLQALPESAQALWSGWLIGCVVVYGLLPRLVGVVVSLWCVKRRVADLSLDSHLPGYAELRERLAPISEKTGLDGPAGAWAPAPHDAIVAPAYTDTQALMVGLELASDTPWPPFPLPNDTLDLGLIDTRPQRQQLLEQFQQQPPAKLLLVCDPQQTPDRGTLALLNQLSGLAHHMRILLLAPQSTRPSHDARIALWRQQLAAVGFLADDVQTHPMAAHDWLNTRISP